jgi:hypothetical protein
MLGPVEKRLLAAGAILVWLGLLVIRVLLFVSSSWPEAPGQHTVTHKILRVNRAQTAKETFETAFYERLKPFQNVDNPFYINPAQPPPPTPPPVVRQVDLLYQGSISTPTGDRKAFLKVADQTVIGGIGTKISAYFTIGEINARNLSLRDPAGKTTVLEFNVPKTAAIPIQ